MCASRLCITMRKLEADGKAGRLCAKQLEADGACPRCGDSASSMSVLVMNEATFTTEDGSTFKLTAFGDLAGLILDTNAPEAVAWEDVSRRTHDSTRDNQMQNVAARLGRIFDLSVKVEKVVLESGKEWVSATIFHAVEVAAAAVAVGAESGSVSEPKRARHQ